MQRVLGFYYVGQDARWRWPWASVGTKSGAIAVSAVEEDAVLSSRATRLQTLRGMVNSAIERKAWRVTDSMLQWARSSSPEVVYVQVGSPVTCRFALDLIRVLELPLVVHQMDDWLWSDDGAEKRSNAERRRSDEEFATLINLAGGRLAISEGMAREYEKRYGGMWEVFHNGIDVRAWSSTRDQGSRRNVQFRLRYGGRVGWGIGSSLILCARAVESLRKEGLDIWLDVYSSDWTGRVCRQLAAIQGITVSAPVPSDELRPSMEMASAQLIAYDFDQNTKGRGGLSMPTKLSECLASRRPIFIVAPSELTLCAEAVGGGWAHVVSKPSVDEIARGLRRLAMDADYCQDLVARAWSECLRNHSAASTQQRFSAVLSRTASGQ